MDWSQHSIPAMRLEPRFGDRIVPAFCERPRSIPAMVAEAVARNADGEALVCGATRMTWREVAQRLAQIAAGFQSSACSAATASRCCSATEPNSC
jgi:non-ribosomal peptide synthetase component F